MTTPSTRPGDGSVAGDADRRPEDATGAASGAADRPRLSGPVIGAAVGVVALAGGLVLGVLLSGSLGGSGVPPEGSVDAGFARDMQRHHDQAVEMAVLVRDASEDPALRQLALDIALTQQHQSGQMRGWLDAWGLPPVTDDAPMAWAGDHGHDGGRAEQDDDHHEMVGLADEAEMSALRSASGVEAERLFLTLMVEHHEGGVEMAELAVDRAERPEVRRLAEGIVTSQTAEIDTLETLLADLEESSPAP